MPRRTHKGDRKRRKARPPVGGLTRSQKRSTSNPRTRAKKFRLPIDYARFKGAMRKMNRGVSLTAAAREEHVSRERLRAFLTEHRLAKRKGRRWLIKKSLIYRVLVMSRGRPRVLAVRGYPAARLVGEHHRAARKFVGTNDIELLEPFRGRTVDAVNGRRYPLETDPNALHRIAAMDTPPFHEIYEIISPT